MRRKARALKPYAKNRAYFPFSISHFPFAISARFVMRMAHGKFRSPKSAQERADKLEERLIDFSVRIVNLSANLPKTPAGKHIAGQIMRSGTSPAPNYGEARGAESHADFIHKLRIVLKELNEMSIWLRIIERSHLIRKELLRDIVGENKELCRIFTASLKTARNGLK
jgi:four helix bundle protein